MSFKKYVISVVVCAFTIFSMIFNMFVPIQILAASWEQEVLNAWTSYGVSIGIPYLPSSFSDYNGWNSSVDSQNTFYDFLSDKSELSKKIYVTYITDTSIKLDVYYYDSITNIPSSVYASSVTFNNWCKSSYVLSTQSTGLKTFSFSYITGSYGSYNQSYSGFRYDYYYNYPDNYYIQCSTGSADSSIDSSDSSSFFGRLWDGLKNMWYGFGEDTSDFWFGDDNIIDYWDNIGNDWCDFIKTTLGIDDDSTLNTVMQNIYNNDYSSDFWADIDSTTITQIRNTSNNIKQFWQNNVTVVDDGDSYHYEINNFDNITNTYPSYLYDNDYFYEYIVYQTDTNVDDTNSWLKKIYNAIIDLPSRIKSNVTTNVTNTYNYLFVPSDDFWDEWDLKFDSVLDDKFPIIQQVEDFTDNVGSIVNSYSEDDFAVGSISGYFSFDDTSQFDISNVETSYTGYVPKISIDLSNFNLMGYSLGDGKVVIMDFTWYLKYRPLIFTIIIVITYTWFIISLGKSLPRLIGNVADVLDYRQDAEVANSINEYNESAYYFSGLAKNSKE